MFIVYKVTYEEDGPMVLSYGGYQKTKQDRSFYTTSKEMLEGVPHKIVKIEMKTVCENKHEVKYYRHNTNEE